MSLTAANANITLSVPGLFSAPQQIQGFSTDDVFDVDEIKFAETLMGVDGNLSAGFVYNETVQKFHLQSDSASIAFFDQWAQTNIALQDTLPATGTIVLPGIRTAWDCIVGYLTDGPPMPSVKKLIGPRMYTVRWQSCTPGPAPQILITL